MADNQWRWQSRDPRYGPPAGYPLPPPPAGYPVPAPGSVPPPASYPGQQAYPGQRGGYQMPMTPSMRASAADRERTVDVLKAGFAEGRLTRDEYDERIGRAYAARTYGELNVLIADLPAGAVPLPSGGHVGAYRSAAAPTNSLAIAAMVLGAAEVFTFGLTAIPAVLCGHHAMRQIRQTGQSGAGLATGGLVLGYLAIIFWALRIATHGGL